MREQPSLAGRTGVSAAFATRCASCSVSTTIRHGVVETSDDRRSRVTYADPDIVVWDCPSCGVANADVLEER